MNIKGRREGSVYIYIYIWIVCKIWKIDGTSGPSGTQGSLVFLIKRGNVFPAPADGARPGYVWRRPEGSVVISR